MSGRSEVGGRAEEGGRAEVGGRVEVGGRAGERVEAGKGPEMHIIRYMLNFDKRHENRHQVSR